MVVSYDAVFLDGTVDEVPDLIERIYSRKGSDGQSLRILTFEDGFPTEGDEPEHLTARLARLVSGEAVVSATVMEE